MADETQQEPGVLPPENVPQQFRPYYSLLVDRALDELKKGRSEVEIRIELNKITPPKAFLEAFETNDQALSDAIRYAKSVFAPSIRPELVRIEPIIEKLGSPEPPKPSDLFEMLKQLRERERLIRTAGFEAQRSALRTSLDEITQRLGALKIPTKQAGAFPFDLTSASVTGLALPSPQQQGLIPDAEYSVTAREGSLTKGFIVPNQPVKFVRQEFRNDGEYLIFKVFPGIERVVPRSDIVSMTITCVPASAAGLVQGITLAPRTVTEPITPSPSSGVATFLLAPSPLRAEQQSLTLPAGTEDTRRAIDAKLAEGFVLSKATTNPDGTATFIFTSVTATAPQAPPAFAQPSPSQPTLGKLVRLSGGRVGRLVLIDGGEALLDGIMLESQLGSGISGTSTRLPLSEVLGDV